MAKDNIKSSEIFVSSNLQLLSSIPGILSCKKFNQKNNRFPDNKLINDELKMNKSKTEAFIDFLKVRHCTPTANFCFC